jgi:hypothetical protein
MQNFNSLPADTYGVHVENDIDHLKLLWLLDKIGEKKLRASAAKYEKKYGGSRVFVSTLLKWYQLVVPPKVYAEQYIPMYCVYVLVLRQDPIIKLGFTGRWPNRAFGYVKHGSYEGNMFNDTVSCFDIDRSCAFFTDTKKEALQLENSAKIAFEKFRVQPPFGLKGYGVRESREWFSNEIYSLAIKHFSSFDLADSDRGFCRGLQTLRTALDLYKETSC